MYDLYGYLASWNDGVLQRYTGLFMEMKTVSTVFYPLRV